MKLIRGILDIIAVLGCYVLLSTLFHFISDLIAAKKTGIRPKLSNYINIHSRSDVSLFFVALLGVVYALSFLLFAKPEIGAFLEKLSYETDYEATLSSEYTSFYCIATVRRDDDGYFITKLLMPYGHEVEVDDLDGYSPKHNISEIYLGTDDRYDCQVSLGVPATQDSYTRINQYAVSNYGVYCASKGSDKYHSLHCPHVKNISKENLVYFNVAREAEILGFYACKTCKPYS